MNRLLTFCAVLLVLSGCAGPGNDGVKWFKTEKAAISYGLKEEHLTERNIIGQVEKNGEKFIFIKEGTAPSINLASIARKNGKYGWFMASSYTGVTTKQVKWDTQTRSGKEFWVYAGRVPEKKEIILQTEEGNIIPLVDKDSGIYFALANKK